jgi:hypothetical protein
VHNVLDEEEQLVLDGFATAVVALLGHDLADRYVIEKVAAFRFPAYLYIF